ncbi:MAG: glycerophosphodiester phosphodiesterase family protein, partial [Alphaproteobacteria bacterium]
GAAGVSWVDPPAPPPPHGLVVFHDDTLDRTTDGSGPLRSATLEHLGSLDAGSRYGRGFSGEPIPVFEDAVEAVQRLGLSMNVEIKTDDETPRDLVDAIVACVRRVWRGGPDRLLYSSFSPAAVAAVRDAAPDYPRGLIAGRLPAGWETTARELGCVSLHLGCRDLTAAQVSAVRAAGYALAVWTVNDRAEAERLFAWGVDTIITDDPEAMRDLG